MSGINKAIILGNVGKEPDIRYAPSGTTIASFTVATSENWKDKQTGEKREETEWHNITAFGKLAEIVEKYIHKGSKVYIEGKIKTEKWQDQDGKDRYSTKIIANQMQMLDGKQQPNEQALASNQQQDGGFDGFDDKDIPFMRLQAEYCL